MTTTLSLIRRMKFCFPVLYHSKAPSLIAERARFVEHARGEVWLICDLFSVFLVTWYCCGD